jgi:hypothetical protein
MNLLFAVTGVASTLIPRAHAALQIGQESVTSLCGIVPCSIMGGGLAGLQNYVLGTVVTALELGVVAIAIIALLATAFQMVIFASQEETSKQMTTSYVYIIVGLAVVALAQWVVEAFAPGQTGPNVVNTPVVENAIANVATYVRLALGIALMANIVIQGFRLLTSQGEQDQVDKARKRIIAGFIGAAVILLANAIVVAIDPTLGGGATAIAIEIAGIGNYIVTILGFFALLGFIFAGILLLLSVTESMKERAKSIMKTSAIALIVVVLSYAFIYAFIIYDI